MKALSADRPPHEHAARCRLRRFDSISGGKKSFPDFDAERYLVQPFIRALPEALRAGIARHGIRNSHLLSIAPAGTISLLANNLSCGMEPIFGLESLRRLLDEKGQWHHFQAEDYAYSLWRQGRAREGGLPEYFSGLDSIAPSDQLLMQAELQPFVDGAISKTIALRRSAARSDVSTLFQAAFDLRVKGCTVFREGSRKQSVSDWTLGNAYCCPEEREAD